MFNMMLKSKEVDKHRNFQDNIGLENTKVPKQ